MRNIFCERFTRDKKLYTMSIDIKVDTSNPKMNECEILSIIRDSDKKQMTTFDLKHIIPNGLDVCEAWIPRGNDKNVFIYNTEPGYQDVNCSLPLLFIVASNWYSYWPSIYVIDTSDFDNIHVTSINEYDIFDVNSVYNMNIDKFSIFDLISVKLSYGTDNVINEFNVSLPLMDDVGLDYEEQIENKECNYNGKRYRVVSYNYSDNIAKIEEITDIISVNKNDLKFDKELAKPITKFVI